MAWGRAGRPSGRAPMRRPGTRRSSANSGGPRLLSAAPWRSRWRTPPPKGWDMASAGMGMSRGGELQGWDRRGHWGSGEDLRMTAASGSVGHPVFTGGAVQSPRTGKAKIVKRSPALSARGQFGGMRQKRGPGGWEGTTRPRRRTELGLGDDAWRSGDGPTQGQVFYRCAHGIHRSTGLVAMVVASGRWGGSPPQRGSGGGDPMHLWLSGLVTVGRRGAGKRR